MLPAKYAKWLEDIDEHKTPQHETITTWEVVPETYIAPPIPLELHASKTDFSMHILEPSCDKLIALLDKL